MQNNYYNSLAGALKENDLNNANFVVMAEMGKILSQNREDFIYLLTNSGIAVNNDTPTTELIDLYIENLPKNKDLMVGSALLVGQSNATIGFDGEKETDQDGLKATYKVMNDYYSFDDDYSEAGGLWGSVVDTVGKIGGGIIKGQHDKKFGQVDAYNKQKEAKNAMLQSVLEQRKQQQEILKQKNEQKSKNQKIALIVGGSILGIALIIGGIYMYKNSKKSK